MAGQVIKRGEQKYVVRVFLGRDPDSGKRRYMNKTVLGTKKQAEQTLTAMQRAKDTGTLLEPVKMSLNTLLDRWLETAVKPRVSERTFHHYTWIAVRYVRPALGERLLTHVKPYDLQALYADMLGRGYSPQTIRHTQKVVHNAYQQAIRWQLAGANPAQHVDLPKKAHREMQAMSEHEAGRFLAACEGEPLHALFALLLGTGLRPSEAAALKWSDLDTLTKTLSVQRTVQRPKGGGWTFDTTKTRRGTRTLALPDSLITVLLGHKASAPPTPHGLMFPAENGEALDVKNVRRRNFAEVLSRAGLEGFNLYSLRHTHATMLLAAGVHPKKVSERLGHATISITLDTYSHVLPNMQQEIADKLEALLFKPNQGEARAFN